eukprot:gb/GECH01007791.1/.p1 GENE.gb/GECH01007791.1/~~gb/GECH01007791.1/.p1  ORF type:complete len:207 (+),score=48.15 gb/GECH01007791.1/:1-621(+)
MSATSQVTQNNITLKGSCDIVTEFFGYSINSILYQRGIYPPDTFRQVKKYGLVMLVTKEEGLKNYLDSVLKQLYAWLLDKAVQKLVLVVSGVDSQQVMERWVFNVETDKSVSQDGPGKTKSEKDIMNEIQAVIRQITASVTFLPLLDEPCTFDLLVYADNDCQVPVEWEESDPKYISNSSEVRLRSFTTKVHKVDPMVSYRRPDDE